MTTASFQETYGRGFDKLYAEISAYAAENTLWDVAPGTSNSAGNLCLHLLGNINHFIGAQLGNTGYAREREREFSDKHVPRETLLANIRHTQEMALRVLGTLTADDLQKTYPIQLQIGPKDTEYMLVFFAIHLEYHLGQINYHRRVLEQA